MLTSPPVLCIPALGKPFVVRMDASNTHIGAVLEQSGQPVAYFSHKLSPRECNYLVTDHELLAIFFSSMSDVALLPIWGQVNSGLYRSQDAGASVYPATVEPPLDTLDGEAS